MSAANRRRGHDAERSVVRYLKTQGFVDACTTRAKLGHDGATAPGDIDFHPLITLEVKDVANSAWPSWCRQAAAEAPVGTVPVVVRRTRGRTDVGRWECRYHASTWAKACGNVHPYGNPVIYAGEGPDFWMVTNMATLTAAVWSIDAPPVQITGEQNGAPS